MQRESSWIAVPLEQWKRQSRLGWPDLDTSLPSSAAVDFDLNLNLDLGFEKAAERRSAVVVGCCENQGHAWEEGLVSSWWTAQQRQTQC